MRFEVVQIVPYLPPTVSGVGDHAGLLAQVLRDRHEIATRFVVGNLGASEASAADGFVREHLANGDGTELATHLNAPGAPEIAILHYVGYGYQKRGCPCWLIRALTTWRRAAPQRRLLTMFHELYAFGPIWRSSFWVSPLQRHLARALAQLSDHCLTSQNLSGQWLARAAPRRASPISVLPVFSTVGETPPSETAAMQRGPTMVLFGSPAWRRRAYDEYRMSMESACEALRIRRIVDIGAPCGAIPKLIVPVLETGVIPAAAVSGHLARARAGFFSYPASYLGKSSIFAAYAAHAVLPVTYAGNTAVNLDGVRAGEHFFVAGKTPATSACDFAAIADAANSWYQTHNLNRQANYYAEILGTAKTLSQ